MKLYTPENYFSKEINYFYKIKLISFEREFSGVYNFIKNILSKIPFADVHNKQLSFILKVSNFRKIAVP